MQHSHRHAGPKSTQYNDLEKQINQYYEMLQKKRHDNANRFAVNIRKHILLYGCPEDDIIAETNSSTNNNNQTSSTNNNNNPNNVANGTGQSGRRLLTRIGRALPTMRRVEDTLRGKLWRLVLGVSNLDASSYKNQIKKAESRDYYIKIRGDTKRTFLTSEEYNSRVSEERLVRVLNSFVHRYNKPYCQGMDAIAAGLLYVMPELDAFSSFSLLINHHFPTYFYSDKTRKKDLIGAYAGSYLSWDILAICDPQIFNHLRGLPAHTYFFPLVASFHAISQPFTELQRLWDFLFCFGVHLNPVLAAAQIIVNKKLIINQNPARLLQGLLSQRKWMNQRLNSKAVINCAMHLIITLKKNNNSKLWQSILKHSHNFDTALLIKIKHENNINSNIYKTITSIQPTATMTIAATANITNDDIQDIDDHDDDDIDDDDDDDKPKNTPQLNRTKTQSEENFDIVNANNLNKSSQHIVVNDDDDNDDDDDADADADDDDNPTI